MSSICDDLRAAILQAAMQGKLTEQLPEDGDAEKLFKEIYASKNSNKKVKKLNDITDEDIPFEIPENWRWIRAGFVCDIISGTSYSSKDLSPNGIRIYRGGNVIDGGLLVNLEDDVRIKEQLADEEKKVRRGDVVIVASTGSQKVIGKPCIVADDGDGYIGAFLRILRANQLIIPEYFWCYIRSDLYRDAIRTRAVGTNINNVKTEYIAENVFPLPPLAEQKRIVEKVDELMARVADLEKSADALVSLKKSFPDNIKASLLQAAMQGKLTEQLPEDGTAEELLGQIKVEKEKLIAEGKIKKQKPLTPITDDEIPFEIPDNWKWVRLPEVADSMLGKTLNKSTDMGEEKPYLCSINIYWEGISLDKIKTAKFSKNDIRQYLLRKNDLLVCEGGDVGRAAIWTNEREMYYQNALHRIRFYGGINAEYMLEVLNCYKRMGIIEDYSKGVTIKHFVQTSLNKMPIPLPPLAEQKRIVGKINNLMSRIEPIEDMING